jgi:hypothetical protein
MIIQHYETLPLGNSMEAELYSKGFVIIPTDNLIDYEAVSIFYNQTHHFTSGKGGTFWSIFSQDTAYKETVHKNLSVILKPFLDRIFINYRSMINAFVVKVAGSNSYMHLHRDTTSMDENIHSPISLWLPLNDVDENNGALYFVPKSHHLSPLYRAVTIPPDYRELEQYSWKYAVPIVLKRGEAVIFDPRLLHFSTPNLSDCNRVAIVSSIFPAEAKLETCYLNKKLMMIETYLNDDDFMFTNPNFLVNSMAKPISGRLNKQIPFIDYNLTAEFFDKWCKDSGLIPTDFIPKSTDGFPLPENQNTPNDVLEQ